MSDTSWRPTGGKDSLLEVRLRLGTWNGKPIYIHFTSLAGLNGINQGGVITATPKQDRRGGKAKNGVYLNPVSQTFGPKDAWVLLFFMNATYLNSANYCFVFAFLEQPGGSCFKSGPITDGSWVQEVIYNDHIKFSDIDILYRGPNPFVDHLTQT
jgi:hypothetical protein